MAAYVKYESGIENIWNKNIDLFGTTDTLNIALTNTAPNVATHTVRGDITELTTGNGYTQDTHDTQNDATRTGGTITVTGVDVVITASGAVGPFRYPVWYDTTSTTPPDPLIAYWDYGSSPTLASGETFTVDFGASIHTAS